MHSLSAGRIYDVAMQVTKGRFQSMEVGDSEVRWLFVEVYGWMRIGVEMHDAMPRCVRHVHVGLKICCEGIGWRLGWCGRTSDAVEERGRVSGPISIESRTPFAKSKAGMRTLTLLRLRAGCWGVLIVKLGGVDHDALLV
jgi:hypothetical protein